MSRKRTKLPLVCVYMTEQSHIMSQLVSVGKLKDFMIRSNIGSIHISHVPRYLGNCYHDLPLLYLIMLSSPFSLEHLLSFFTACASV